MRSAIYWSSHRNQPYPHMPQSLKHGLWRLQGLHCGSQPLCSCATENPDPQNLGNETVRWTYNNSLNSKIYWGRPRVRHPSDANIAGTFISHGARPEFRAARCRNFLSLPHMADRPGSLLCAGTYRESVRSGRLVYARSCGESTRVNF
jgi:hypothetical protein